MNIVGISGIHDAIHVKRSQWPGREEREYRISQGHDSAAALVVDGVVAAAVAEERISRSKHTGDFPVGAIRFCLDQGGISIDDVDELVHCFDFAPFGALFGLDPLSKELMDEAYSRDALLSHVTRHFPELAADRVVSVDHHLAHAASAYFTSGWDECLVIVLDGMGEAHSVTVYDGRDGELVRLQATLATDSIGILYGLVTLHLGFDFNADEYKIMGLAPYGDPSRFAAFFEEAVRVDPSGAISIPMLHLNRTREEREFYLATRRHLTDSLVEPRTPDSPIDDVHRDVAAALQECLDRTLLTVCTHFGQATGHRRLALAGGVALNCTSNGKLLAAGVFDEIYVQPAAADDGAALGAALLRSSLRADVANRRSPVPFLGPAFGHADIESAISAQRDHLDVTRFGSPSEMYETVANLIAAGRVVAWYLGRMEFGPRALGHRSILADPGGAEMRDRINGMVKMREAFRPFAPAVTEEEVDRWFDVPPGTKLPFMIMTVDVREEHRASLPAITHVNGSARVQTVSASDNPEFHALLQAVGRATGREMVLNTSFNVKGQPIVNTPADAIETFLATGIEFLVLDSTLVAKRDAGS